MAARKHIRWLYEELPALVERGLIGENQAEAIKGHYGPVPKVGGRKTALVVFSIVGSLLIGAGVILLLAHNWSQLTRPARTFLALAPLVCAQAYGVQVVRRKKGVAARESAATFISLLYASAVAVVGQTYHIGGDVGGFLLSCSVLIIPLAFIMDAVVPAALYMGAVTGWLGYQRVHDEKIYLFLLLIVPAIAHYIRMVRMDRYSGRASFLGWVLAVCIPISTGFTLEYRMEGAWVVVFASVFSVMYLAAKQWFDDAESVWASPFKAIGAAGITVMAFVLTYGEVWDEIMPHRWWDLSYYRSTDAVFMLVPVAVSLLLALPLVRRRRIMETLTGGMGLVAAFTFGAVMLTQAELLGMMVFNAYVLAVSISRIVSGLKGESVGKLNSGMLTLGLLIMLRFIDSDFDFLAKGIVFIVLGAGFLTVNLMVLRKKKEVSQ